MGRKENMQQMIMAGVMILSPTVPILAEEIHAHLSPDPGHTLQIDDPVVKEHTLGSLEQEELKYTEIPWEKMNFKPAQWQIDKYTEIILENANEFDIPPEVICGIMQQESLFGLLPGNAQTGMGEMGVMPQSEELPNRPTEPQLWNSHVNIRTGTGIFDQILRVNTDPRYSAYGDYVLALALYNAGHIDNIDIPNRGLDYAMLVLMYAGREDLIYEYYLKQTEEQRRQVK